MVNPTESATFTEICGQPAVWRELAESLTAGAADTRAFLEPILAAHNARIILTGAGTSAFVGEIAAPALMGATGMRVEAVPTTDIVSNPTDYLIPDVPTLLVSFARSGNSPESVAATELLDQLVTDAYHLVITCAADGALAVARGDHERSHVLLMPATSNDRGFAMTSSFSSMLLAVLTSLGPWEVSDIERLAVAAEGVIARSEEIAALTGREPSRVVYLGSGPLRGLAHESGLKLLDLTAGEVVSFYESSLGFRHGPKAVLTDDTQVVVFVSADEHTRRYDLDIVREIRHDRGQDSVLVIASAPVDVEGAWVWPGLEGLDDALVAAVHIVLAQLYAVHTSARLGKTIDNPFPQGDVNRVVKGVVIHPYEGAPATVRG